MSKLLAWQAALGTHPGASGCPVCIGMPQPEHCCGRRSQSPSSDWGCGTGPALCAAAKTGPRSRGLLRVDRCLKCCSGERCWVIKAGNAGLHRQGDRQHAHKEPLFTLLSMSLRMWMPLACYTCVLTMSDELSQPQGLNSDANLICSIMSTYWSIRESSASTMSFTTSSACRHVVQLYPCGRQGRLLQCHAQSSTNGAGEPLLLRAARGQGTQTVMLQYDAVFAAVCSYTPGHAEVERSPVWLMRQAGRYMKAFKA